MNSERFPADLVVTVADFEHCGWQDALPADDVSYASIWQALSKAAQQTADEGRTAHGKVLWLLANACGMMLKPSSNQAPFEPYLRMQDGRSAIPDDFSADDIAFLSSIAGQITHARIRARITDLAWFMNRRVGIGFVLDAIDAYRSIPLDLENWHADGRVGWKRAVRLALAVGGPATERLQAMEAAIVAAFDAPEAETSLLPLWLAELLFDHRLGRDSATHIADRLRAIAAGLQADDLHRKRAYLQQATKWFRRLGDQGAAAETAVATAEAWASEAALRTSGGAPSHMAAAHFYEKAIQVFRAVPRRLRAQHRVEERIAELHTAMTIANERLLGEMGTVTSPGVDIRDIVEASRSMIAGRPGIEALAAFVDLYEGADVARVRSSAEEAIRRFPLQTMFEATYHSHDGRVIARSPAAGFGEAGSDGATVSPNVWAQMVRQYTGEIEFVVQAQLMPALQVLQLEHRITEGDFYSLALQSPLVPPEREALFSKGLFAGFDSDFGTALHLLVPQIEHVVRVQLKARGVTTTTLDPGGIERENGLSTIANAAEMESAFGDNLSFEIRALFCDALGPNLRNELAHGLVNDSIGGSPRAIYAWWLILKLVFNTYWNAKAETTSHVAEDSKR